MLEIVETLYQMEGVSQVDFKKDINKMTNCWVMPNWNKGKHNPRTNKKFTTQSHCLSWELHCCEAPALETSTMEQTVMKMVFLYCRPFLASYWRICLVCSQDSSSCRAQEIFSKIDLDANGKLTQQEFIKGCLKELNSSYYPNPSVKKWNQIRLSSLSLNIRTVTLLTFLARGE